MRFALAAILTALPLAAQQCDRVCLRDMLDQYLAALVKHDPGTLPLSSMVRFTEDGFELIPGEGLWKTATGLGTFRQDVLDVRQSTAGTHTVILEHGKPVQFVLRLKVFGLRIHEIETMVVRNASGLEISPMIVTGRTLPPREEAIRAAAQYAAGRKMRTVAVDEAVGTVWMRIDYGDRIAWQMLQVDGSIVFHSISKPMPPGSPSGWD